MISRCVIAAVTTAMASFTKACLYLQQIKRSAGQHHWAEPDSHGALMLLERGHELGKLAWHLVQQVQGPGLL